MKKEKAGDKKKRDSIMLTFFILGFPVILLAAIPSYSITFLSIRVGLAIYLLVILKNFIEDYHKRA